MRVNHREDELENHDRGLDYDLPKLLHRRGMLKLVAGASVVALAGCATAQTTSSDTAATPADGSPSGARPGGPPPGEPGSGGGSNREVSAGEIPEETAGPYPGDGSNGANVLTESGVVRSDITSSFGSSTTKAPGVPVTLTMTMQNFDKDKAAYAGVAVYVWHCDQAGQYSMYSEAIQNENYLRGVQEADANGKGHLHHDLPGLLLRPLAAHPLRGLPQPGQGHQQREQDRDVADRPARGRVERGLRHVRLRAERSEHEPGQPRFRQRLLRRL